MPIVTNTTNIPTVTVDAVFHRTEIHGVREAVREEINNSDIYQFITWLLTHDPEFKRKFIAFKAAKRMGVVK